MEKRFLSLTASDAFQRGFDPFPSPTVKFLPGVSTAGLEQPYILHRLWTGTLFRYWSILNYAEGVR